MTQSDLQVGFSAVDITPPVGLLMCGGLDPRTNVGLDDPLLVKTLVVAAGARALVPDVHRWNRRNRRRRHGTVPVRRRQVNEWKGEFRAASVVG